MKLQFTPIKCALVLSLFIGGTTLLSAENRSANTTQTHATNAISVTSVTQPDDGLFKLKENQEEIISQCLTFKPLLDKIPTDVKDKMGQYFILNQGKNIEIPSKIEVDGIPVLEISKSEINSIEAFYTFHYVKIEEHKALVRYVFTYTKNDIITTIPISIEFTKINSQWKESNYKILN